MAKIHDIESQLPAIPKKVRSFNLSIKGEVRKAEDTWEGAKETNADVYPVLKSYWDTVGWDESDWTPSSKPWSAAFVSHLLRKYKFPGDALHMNYVERAMQGQGGWQAFSIPKNKDKLVVAVGDVLVEPRSGSYTASHGDVIYNIRSGAADLVGGNVGDTVGHKSIGLNKDGTISDPKSYLILLKRNPQSPILFWIKKIAFYTLVLSTIGVTGYATIQYYQSKKR